MLDGECRRWPGKLQEHAPLSVTSSAELTPERILLSRSTHELSLLAGKNVTRAVVAAGHRSFRMVVRTCLSLTPITESVGSIGVGIRYAVPRRGGGP
jgi:hypothetical protein